MNRFAADTREYLASRPLERKTAEQNGLPESCPDGRGRCGFTLIELVVVIVIVGILSALGGQFVVAPVTGYIDLSRRARLVDQAEMALRRLQRDIRTALPNSITVTETSVTMINTVDGGRYRRYVDPNLDCAINPLESGCDILDFTIADASFDVLGSLRDALSATDHSIVVYNVSSGETGNRAKVGGGSTVSRIVLDPPFSFPQPSPYQRFFVVDDKITYRCEGGDLNRYQAAMSDAGDGVGSLVTRGMSNCQFTYDPGVTQRAGLVTMKLTVEEAGEKITLLHQVHVLNAP